MKSAALVIFAAAIGSAFGQTNVAPVAAPTTNIGTTNVASTNAPAAEAPKVDPFSDPLIIAVQARHEKAFKGDTKETKSLTADLEKWTREQPKNFLLLAYLGSVYTLDSRDSWPGPGKLDYLKKGGLCLDNAVTAEPHNPAVRFVRAIDYYELPTLFGKRQTARDDFKLLVDQVEGTVKVPYVLNLETRQAIYYYAGLSHKQMSQAADAKRIWLKGLALDPASDLGKKISAELGKLR
jgi:hypothetical protein